MFLVAYRHGLRASEVSLLQKTDLDLASTKITIQRLTRRPSEVHTIQRDEAVALEEYLRSREDAQRPFSWVYAVMPSLVEVSTGL
jgi:integrase